MVRARDSKDLQHIRDWGYDTGRIIAMTNADYPYRIIIKKDEWARYLVNATTAIDYVNFKSRIHEVDRPRGDIYLKVWRELLHIEDDDWDRELVAVVAADEDAR
jgi:hypothetical protein